MSLLLFIEFYNYRFHLSFNFIINLVKKIFACYLFYIVNSYLKSLMLPTYFCIVLSNIKANIFFSVSKYNIIKNATGTRSPLGPTCSLQAGLKTTPVTTISFSDKCNNLAFILFQDLPIFHS